MSLLSRLANRLILQPTTFAIDPGEQTKLEVPVSFGQIEVWTQDYVPDDAGDNHLLIIKFPGAGGRAERSSPVPAAAFSNVRSTIWTINYPGYGGSSGPPQLDYFFESAMGVWNAARQHADPAQILLVGNSLGGIVALAVAAAAPAGGIFLRNPPPLKEMISQRPRYNWWNFGMARFIAE